MALGASGEETEVLLSEDLWREKEPRAESLTEDILVVFGLHFPFVTIAGGHGSVVEILGKPHHSVLNNLG